MKGKVLLSGLVIALLTIVGKFTLDATVSTLPINAILPLFVGIDVMVEYGLAVLFSLLGFLVLGITLVIKPNKTETKWQDEEGKTHTKSTNKYLIGVGVGLVLIFFAPISQLIMLPFLTFDNNYLILFILTLFEGIGWVIAGYGLSAKIISKCLNCNNKIEKGKEIKCKSCDNKFCSEECYDAHMLYTHDKCAICGKGFGRGDRYEICPHSECSHLKFCSPNHLKEHEKLKH